MWSEMRKRFLQRRAVISELMIVFYVVSITITSCENKKSQDKVGKYLYNDEQEIYHIDSNCSSLMHQGKERGVELYGKEMYDTSTFVIEDRKYFRVCANCVGDDEYDHISRISQRNKSDQHNYENRKWLYDKFVRANYDMEGFDDFVKNLSDTEKRRRVYKAALDEKWDVGYTFEDFSAIMGF